MTKTLNHTASGFTLAIAEGMTQAAILTAIKTAGQSLGATSLRELLNGKKTEANGFTVMDSSKEAADDAKTAPAVVTTEAAPAKAPKTHRVPAKTLTPEQAAIAAAAEAANPTAPAVNVEKKPRGKDWSSILPQEPVALRKDSMGHNLFMMLCTPGGVTKEEMIEKFNWTEGGFGGILHWEPKAKGYKLVSVKGADGKLRYHLESIKEIGRCYKPEEILFKERAEVAPKKTPEERAAEKAAKTAQRELEARTKAAEKANAAAAAKAAKAPAAGGEPMVNVTKRVSKKAQQAQA